MKKYGFTLIEVLVASVLFFMIIIGVLATYRRIIIVSEQTQMNQRLLSESFRIQRFLKEITSDYSVDYEELYNQNSLGCEAFSTGCFSFYGNNSVSGFTYCSSSVTDENTLILSGCLAGLQGSLGYGQYKTLFKDVGLDSNNDGLLYGDIDDKDLGDGPGINDISGAVFLISRGGDKRIFLRVKTIADYDCNGNQLSGESGEVKKTLQILRLKGFDIGTDHDSTKLSSGAYDKEVDTWACDAELGFLCKGQSLGGLYSGYSLPLDENDGRVTLLQDDIQLDNFAVVVMPKKSPLLARNDGKSQLKPYIQLSYDLRVLGRNFCTTILGPSRQQIFIGENAR